MPLVAKIKKDFLGNLSSCRSLYRHCLSPKGAHTEAGVEAAFLQMFRAWESFLEDCSLAFMCGKLRCDALSVSCHVRTLNEETARGLIYQDRPYVEWTDVDKVIQRWDRLFPPLSLLVSAIRPAKLELSQMAAIRNAIAHSSLLSREKFQKVVQSHYGGKPSISRPADLLNAMYPKDITRTFFDHYADVLEITATKLVG